METKRKLWVTAVALSLLLLVTVGARKSQRMYMPKPISIPTGVSIEEATRAAGAALADLGWQPEFSESEEHTGANEILARLRIRVHRLTVLLVVDSDQIEIRYVSSVNLGYKNHKRRGRIIHPKYTQWIKNVEKEVLLRLLEV